MASEEQTGLSLLPQAAKHTVEAHWSVVLFEGIALLVLGAGSLVVPFLVQYGIANHWLIVRGQLISTRAFADGMVVTLFGWLLLASGFLGLITTLLGRHAPGFVWALLSSAAALAAGALLFVWPGGGVLPLTWTVTCFLGIDGIVTILLAFAYGRAGHTRWYLLLASGVAGVILAAIFALFIPRAAVGAVGPILAIDFLFGGVSLIGLALAASQPSVPAPKA